LSPTAAPHSFTDIVLLDSHPSAVRAPERISAAVAPPAPALPPIVQDTATSGAEDFLQRQALVTRFGPKTARLIKKAQQNAEQPEALIDRTLVIGTREGSLHPKTLKTYAGIETRFRFWFFTSSTWETKNGQRRFIGMQGTHTVHNGGVRTTIVVIQREIPQQDCPISIWPFVIGLYIDDMASCCVPITSILGFVAWVKQFCRQHSGVSISEGTAHPDGRVAFDYIHDCIHRARRAVGVFKPLTKSPLTMDGCRYVRCFDSSSVP
jgi:hypothetical protein